MASKCSNSITLAEIKDGTDGTSVVIKSKEIKYANSTSGTTPPSSGWDPDPSPQKGKYLWSSTTITYGDSEGTWSTVTYSVSYIGSDGAPGGPGQNGRGIQSISEMYAISDSSTIAPSPFDSQVVSPTPDKRFLWNYETITYTDGTSEPTTPRVIGVYGQKGDPGDAGNGISSVVNHYLATTATSGVTTGTSGWDTAMPTLTEGQYLWSYETISYTQTEPVDTTPRIIGSYGKKGDPGIQGGETLYKYALGDSLGNVPADGTFDYEMPSLENTSGYLWFKYKRVEAGQDASSVAWSEAKIAGSDSAKIYSRLSKAELDLNSLYSNATETASTITQNKEDADGKITKLESQITQTAGAIELKVSKDELQTALKITDGFISFDAKGTKLVVGDEQVKVSGAELITDSSIKAKQLDVEDLFSTEITIKSTAEKSGSIHSEAYDSNGIRADSGAIGFYLGANGQLKAVNAVMENVQIINGDADGATLNGDGLSIKGEAVIDSDSLSTANKDKAGDTISYTRSLPTAKYLTDLINAEVAKIAECATGSATSGTSFSMTYKGTTYSTPRKFSSHTQWLSSTFKPTSTGLTITQSFTIPSGQKGKASIGSNGSQDAYWYTEAYTDTHSVYVPAEYTYAWEVTSTYKGYGTKPDNESKPSNPSVGDKYFTYSSVTANTYYIYVNEYTKTKVSDSYWKDEEEYIPAEDGWNAMTLQSTTLTSGGTSYSFDTWLSAGTYTITQKWATYNSSTYDYTGTYRWRNNAYPVFYVYGSYSQYYGLGTFFGSTKWTDLASAWTSDDVSITRGGSVTLQAGSGYSTWTGATKRYYFSHSLTAGSWLIGSGTWNGSAVTSKTPLTISAQSVVFGQKTYNVGTYYTESEYLPTFSLVTIELQAGVHVVSVFPKNSDASLGSSTQPFNAVYANSFYGGTFDGDFSVLSRQRIFKPIMQWSGGSGAFTRRFMRVTMKGQWVPMMNKITFLGMFGGYSELYFSFSNAGSFSPGLSTFSHFYISWNANHTFYCDYNGTDSNGHGIYDFYIYCSDSWGRDNLVMPLLSVDINGYVEFVNENVSVDSLKKTYTASNASLL